MGKFAIEPITPSQVMDLKKKSIPDEVIASFNHLIAQNFDGKRSHFLQEDVVNLIVEKMGMSRNDKSIIFSKNWLNVEELFIGKGWHVEYDNPAYNETYSASFTFEARPRAKKG